MSRRGKLRCLQDFSAEGIDALVECGNPNCRRRVIFNPGKLLDHIKKERWLHYLSIQAEHLRCAECGHKGKARIAPVPRYVEPFDCDEFRADVARIWTRVMTDNAAATETFEVMSKLYACEINCGVETFWDNGLTAFIGDALNGRQAQEAFPFDRMRDIPGWLLDNARRLYPDAALEEL